MEEVKGKSKRTLSGKLSDVLSTFRLSPSRNSLTCIDSDCAKQWASKTKQGMCNGATCNC